MNEELLAHKVTDSDIANALDALVETNALPDDVWYIINAKVLEVTRARLEKEGDFYD